MHAVLGEPDLAQARGRQWPWLAAALGLAALYVPTYFAFAHSVWRDDAYAHAPIVLVVAAWLAWRERAAFLAANERAPVAGAMLLVPGLLLYFLGRAFGLPVFEAASHLPVLAGLVLVAGGFPLLRRLAFPLALLVFVIPIPGFLLDVLTTPLKTVVSAVVASILQLAGYPVERSGVVLDVGGHPMLVADACSGLNSIFGLIVLALVYAHLTPPRSGARMAWLAAAIVPIAIAANVVRVTLLVLVAYHAGEEAAQGFLHGFAGLVVFVVALALLIGFDALVRRRIGTRHAPSAESIPTPRRRAPAFALYAAALAMVGTAAAAPIMKPIPVDDAVDLERVIPQAVGGWHVEADEAAIAPTPDVQASLARLYRQIVSRTYVNDAGERMMLTVAYGGDQSDALKAHRQEKCYEAQGFDISRLEHRGLDVAGRAIPVTRMVATRGERIEPVTYWFTMGDRVVLGRAERLRVQLAEGFAGRIPDGLLVRVSSLSPDAERAFAAQQSFATALFGGLAPTLATRFVGERA